MRSVLRVGCNAEPRLSMSAGGRIRYALKSPWRNGTAHVVFEPLDCIARRAARGG